MRKPRTAKKPSAPRAQEPHPDWITLGLAALGMLITAYLSLVAWMDSDIALCSAESACDLIQQSRWSKVLGLPLALWGFALYALIAALAWRGSKRLKDWRRLWTLALLGLIISVYLTLVGIWNLSAVCLWCLTSLAILTGIFVRLTLSRPVSAPGMSWSQWLLNRGVIAIVVVGALHFYYHYDQLTGAPAEEKLEALAVHLQQSDATFYGASWCAACLRQRQLFGKAQEQLPYVECSPYGRGAALALACQRAGIESFPTWIIDGKRYEGVQEPQDLARYSDFDWE